MVGALLGILGTPGERVEADDLPERSRLDDDYVLTTLRVHAGQHLFYEVTAWL
jgi:hypothetical protein